VTRYGPQYGPDVTFLGVERCDLSDLSSFAGADVVVLGAPFDGGTSHRPGTRFGPQAIRMTDYLPHDGSRPSLALRTDGLTDLRVLDAGDVEMYSGDIVTSLGALERAVETVTASGAIPVVLGGDHSIAFADAKGVANVLGAGRVSMLHFDAHADTGDIEFGSLWGHGQPMRRLIESGALRGDRFLQIGLRGYWPPPETLDWMAAQRMRSYEMTEIGHRGLEACLTEAFGIATDECEGVFLSVDIDVCDPGHAPGTGTPEPGGLTARQLLDAVRRICLELPVVGMDVVEVSPPYDHADITAALANRVVLEALSAIARRRHDAATGERWDPARPLLADRPAAAAQPAATPPSDSPDRVPQA
jgi:agmatinase